MLYGHCGIGLGCWIRFLGGKVVSGAYEILKVEWLSEYGGIMGM